MNKATMKEQVLKYMQEHEFITTYDAFAELGNTRLSEYIRQIKFEHKVGDKWMKTTNQYGKTVRYKRFWLEDEL